jgi:hypothetical protein
MIVKYFSKYPDAKSNGEGCWGYIDNVRQTVSKDIDVDKAVEKYNEEVFESPELDYASYMDGVKLPDDIIKVNKVFSVAVDGLDIRGNSHTENLLDTNRIMEGYHAAVVLLYVEDCKEYDTIILVTNQTVYLMNDKGQTIERLV